MGEVGMCRVSWERWGDCVGEVYSELGKVGRVWGVCGKVQIKYAWEGGRVWGLWGGAE